jgi:hypothetical protein
LFDFPQLVFGQQIAPTAVNADLASNCRGGVRLSPVSIIVLTPKVCKSAMA